MHIRFCPAAAPLFRRGLTVSSTIALLALTAQGCRTATPLVGGGEAVPTRATLSGTVRGPQGSDPLTARSVTAVEVTTGRRHSTRTNESGGFSLLLPAGRYRVEVALAQAERVAAHPGVIELDDGDLVTDADVVLAGAGLVSPP